VSEAMIKMIELSFTPYLTTHSDCLWFCLLLRYICYLYVFILYLHPLYVVFHFLTSLWRTRPCLTDVVGLLTMEELTMLNKIFQIPLIVITYLRRDKPILQSHCSQPFKERQILCSQPARLNRLRRRPLGSRRRR